MGLREEIEISYTDEDGLVLDAPNSSSGPDTGNGIKNLSVYMLLLFLGGELTKDDVESFTKIIRSCEIEPGLYNRGPRKPGDLIAHDDYVALSGASSLIGAPFARDIARYGKNHYWSFNNVDPWEWTFRSFQGRHIPLVPFWSICGGEGASWIGRLILSKSIAWSTSDPGPMILEWVECRALMGRLNDFDCAIESWKQNLFLRFSIGMQSVFKSYYGSKHPFAKYGRVF